LNNKKTKLVKTQKCQQGSLVQVSNGQLFSRVVDENTLLIKYKKNKGFYTRVVDNSKVEYLIQLVNTVS